MPHEPCDPTLWLAKLFESGQEMMLPFIGGGVAPATSHPGLDVYEQFAAATGGVVEMQQNYIKQMSNLWFDMVGTGANPSGAAHADRDKRFAGDAWRNDPRFDLLQRTYLAYSGLLQNSVESALVDDKARRQLRFAVRQFVDAMSPANFLVTNPEAMQLAMETGGASLMEGIALFFKDLTKGRISITDEGAFQPGKDLAVTAGDVIFENDLMQLIQYTPRTPKVYERPLVIIPPCINKFYILDLTPENSFVRYIVERGHTVFMVSWRNITREYDRLTWDDYLQMGVMQAIDVALDVTGARVVNALGFCIGGTLLASAIGVMKANAQDKVASMTLLTAMLDFSEPGEIGALITQDGVAKREAEIGKGGVMEGKDLSLTFSSLRANDLIWPYVVSSYLKGKSPPAFDLLYWNSDGTNLPGPMFCWYVRNMYLENNLRIPGKTIQCGMPVDLSEIDIPTFIYASRDDHIVPWRTAYLSNQLLSGENTFVLGASGHIAGVINPPAKKKRNYWVDGKASTDPEQWLATARDVPGSWWGHYGDWLARHAGRKVAAPKGTGDRKYRRIEPAPGRYVRAKSE